MTSSPTFSPAAETTTPPPTSGPAAPRPSPPGPTSPASPWRHNNAYRRASLSRSRFPSTCSCLVDDVAFVGLLQHWEESPRVVVDATPTHLERLFLFTTAACDHVVTAA